MDDTSTLSACFSIQLDWSLTGRTRSPGGRRFRTGLAVPDVPHWFVIHSGLLFVLPPSLRYSGHCLAHIGINATVEYSFHRRAAPSSKGFFFFAWTGASTTPPLKCSANRGWKNFAQLGKLWDGSGKLRRGKLTATREVSRSHGSMVKLKLQDPKLWIVRCLEMIDDALCLFCWAISPELFFVACLTCSRRLRKMPQQLLQRFPADTRVPPPVPNACRAVFRRHGGRQPTGALCLDSFELRCKTGENLSSITARPPGRTMRTITLRVSR